MADIIGPSRYLPGQPYPFDPDGRLCDDCDVIAKHAIVGETDSFGSEIAHLCDEHRNLVIAERSRELSEGQHCELGDHIALGCQPTRDPSEGTAGRVFMACPECTAAMNRSFADLSPSDDDDRMMDDDDPDEIYAPFNNDDFDDADLENDDDD